MVFLIQYKPFSILCWIQWWYKNSSWTLLWAPVQLLVRIYTCMLNNSELSIISYQGIECHTLIILGIMHMNPGGGGHWPRKGVWGCATVMTPFFQASRRSLAYQFTIIAPLLCPLFSNFGKNSHFQPCLVKTFSSQDANFPNFRSLDPSFFKENPLPRPYFWKPVWHTPTKKKVECPPPRDMNMSASCVSFKNAIVWAQEIPGVLKFGLDEGVPFEPQNLYPSLRVILAEKGTHS